MTDLEKLMSKPYDDVPYDLEQMASPTALADATHVLGLTVKKLEYMTGHNERTIRRWFSATDEARAPASFRIMLGYMLREHGLNPEAYQIKIPAIKAFKPAVKDATSRHEKIS